MLFRSVVTAFVAGAGMVVALVPGWFTDPLFILSAAGAVVVAIIVLGDLLSRGEPLGRRFELPTVQRALAPFLVYLLLASLWPLPFRMTGWQGTLAFDAAMVPMGRIGILRVLEMLAGATVVGRWCHQRPAASLEPLELRRDALHNLLGPVLIEAEEQDLPDARIETTLEALGCVLETSDEGWLVQVPPERAVDLRREVDLIEEVARLVGYDQFSSHLPDPLEPGGLTPEQQAERRLRRALTAAGLQECCSLTLVEAGEGRVPLANPLLADYGHLRDTLHGELLQAARRNLQASQAGFWGFEIGQVFHPTADLPHEESLLVGVIAGERRSELWSSSGKPRCPDYYEARGVLQAALASLQLPIEDRPGDGALAEPGLLHPGRCAQLVVEGRPAGWFGQLHPSRAEALDLPDATTLFSLNQIGRAHV